MIKKDAEELLVLFYERYIAEHPYHTNLTGTEIQWITEWSIDRIERALQYLRQKGLIKRANGLYGYKITAVGIDVIETPQEFEKHFDHSINLGFYSYSWGVKEK